MACPLGQCVVCWIRTVVRRLQQAVRRPATVISCTLLLGGVALSGSLCGQRLLSNTTRQSGATHTHSVGLKWKASASPVAGYNVYRSEKAGGPYTKLTSSPIQATNYIDRAVQSGRIYFYAVTAVDSKGKESVHSNHARASIPSP